MTDHNTAYRGDYDTQPEEDDPLAELARIVAGDAPASASAFTVKQTAPMPQSVPAQTAPAQDDISNLDFAAALAEELDPSPVAEAVTPPESPAAAAGLTEAGLSLEDQLLAEMGQGSEPQPSAEPVGTAPVQSAPTQAELAPSDADAALARLEAVAQSLTREQAGAPAGNEPAADAAEAQSLQGQSPQRMALGNTLIDQDPEPLDGLQDGLADVEADLEAGFAEVFAEELGLDEPDTVEDFDLQGYETAPQADDSGDVIENHFADAFAKELAIDTADVQEMPVSHLADDGAIDPGAFPGGFQDDDFGMEPEPQPAAQTAKQAAGSNRGFRLAVGALIVALLVGTGVVAWGTFGSSQLGEGGEPPVIRADNEPAKVKPEDPGGKVIANQENQVYDRVSGGQGEENNTQEELITSREQPVDVAEKSATRLSPDAEGGTSDAPLGLPPKKVRTLVVKPDGTIVSGGAATMQSDQADGEPLPLSPQPQALAMAQTDDASGSAAQAVQQQETEASSVIALDGARSTGEIATPTPSPLPAPEPPVAVAPAPKPVAPAPAAESDPGAPTQIAAVSESSPQPAAARPAVTSSEWKIQVSSQRSREAAESSFSNIKQRFSSILGSRSAAIERADIDGKGTFYRVKVLADSKSDATDICNRLKGAGGSCFVTR
ncbi:MAG: SPOR domain-containing protein [Nitratireductor sp.]|nr:SPOR domain-containing protein [Nitratireductor sp.]